jgi:hypothetical protein
MSHFKIQVSKKYILATEVRRYAEDIQQFLEEMVKEVLLNRPDKSFFSSYLAWENAAGRRPNNKRRVPSVQAGLIALLFWRCAYTTIFALCKASQAERDSLHLPIKWPEARLAATGMSLQRIQSACEFDERFHFR